MLTHLQKKALQTLKHNKSAKNTKYTPPSPTHYPNGFLWDSNFVSIVYAELSDFKDAKEELEEVLSWQNKITGFIPNMKLGRGRFLDPERFTFNNPSFSSDYTQPPFHALAAWKIYESNKKLGLKFLAKNYNSLFLAYKYFLDFRENGSGSHLVGIIHPHETGRDSDPTFDFFKIRIAFQITQSNKTLKFLNTLLDYAAALNLSMKLKKANWDTKKIKDKKIFWVNDVMFNCIMAQNLYYMSQIAKVLDKKSDEKIFAKLSSNIQKEITNSLWDKKTKMFYAKNIDGKFIKQISISNLSPIILDYVKTEQIERVLDLLDDTDWFNTKFPIPSVPVKSLSFDPHYHEKRLWRGPVWMNTNWLIIEGLLKQSGKYKTVNKQLSKRCLAKARQLSEKSIELAKNGFWEFYDPYTGRGMRIKSFAWSTLAAVIEKRYLERSTF